jgi:hypothetical protein
MNDDIKVQIGDIIRSTQGYTYEVISCKGDQWFIHPIYGPGLHMDLRYIGSFEVVDGSLRKLVEMAKRLYAKYDPIMMPEIVCKVDKVFAKALRKLRDIEETL